MYTYEELKDNLRQMVENQKIEQIPDRIRPGFADQFFIDEKGS